MELSKNKQVLLGISFLILAIILNKISNLSDFTLGILYGITIGILIIGVFKNRIKIFNKNYK